MTRLRTVSTHAMTARMIFARYGRYAGSVLRAYGARLGYHSKPAFLIIGAQKCGTTALASYLPRHPRIQPSCRKEIHFFDRDIAHARGYAWYHGHFPLPCEMGRRALTFDATPSYLYRPKSALRIYEYDPNIKLIVLVRDPVDRAYSQWNMYRLLLNNERQYLFGVTRHSDAPVRQWFDRILAGHSFPDFDKAVKEELDLILSKSPSPEPSYIRRGLYYEQLARYLEYFDCESILVIDSRSLRRMPHTVLDQVTQFVGLPPHNWHAQELPLVHVRPYREEMSERTRALLQEFYRPHNERLYEWLGRDLGWE